MKLYFLFIFITLISQANNKSSTELEKNNAHLTDLFSIQEEEKSTRLITDPVLAFSATGIGTMDNLTTTTSIVNSGTLSVTGTSTLAGVNASSLSLSGNETVTGTLSVTGGLTLGAISASSLSLSGNETVSGNIIWASGTTVSKPSGTLFINNNGTNNTFLGASAGTNTPFGSANTGIGQNALSTLSTSAGAASNTALGQNAGSSITSGSSNIAIGQGAGATLTTGSGNIYINANAGSASEATTIRIGTSQTKNFQLGIRGATPLNTDTAVVSIDSANQLGTGRIYNDIDLATTSATQGAILKNGFLWLHDKGTNNIFLGPTAGNRTTTSSSNIGIGNSALPALTSGGNNNIALGDSALNANQSGSSCIAIGRGSVDRYQSGGNFNIGIGESTLHSIVTASSNNIAIGQSAFTNLGDTSNNNIALGSNAGSSLTSGSNNIYIGNPGISSESGVIRIGSGGTHGTIIIAGAIFCPSIQPTASLLQPLNWDSSTGQILRFVSSIKFKKNIKPIDEITLKNFMSLEPVSYNDINDMSENPKIIYGFIAEDVNNQLPEIVIYDEKKEPITLGYSSMHALLLNIVQNQQITIENQSVEITNLSKKIDSLTLKTEQEHVTQETILTLQSNIKELLIRIIALENL